MINRSVTKKDILVYVLILGIVIGGFSGVLSMYAEPIFNKINSSMVDHPFLKAILLFPFGSLKFIMHIVRIPGLMLRTFGNTKFSLMLGFTILLLYTSRRFFNNVETNFAIIFGGLLYLSYYQGIVLDKNPYYFYTASIVAVPQLVNTLLYFIFKDWGL